MILENSYYPFKLKKINKNPLFHLYLFLNLYIEILKSEIRFDIDKAIRKHGITIPYPQTDIHLKPNPSGDFPVNNDTLKDTE